MFVSMAKYSIKSSSFYSLVMLQDNIYIYIYIYIYNCLVI